jgi:hypothetical protein
LKWPYRWGTALASADDAVAGRLPFPPPPRPLAVASPVLEVFPIFRPSVAGGLRLRRVSVSRTVGPRDLLLSFRVSRLCQDSSQPPKRSESCLSWDSPACSPLPFVFRRVHSRKLALPSVRRCDPSNPVPPLWFRTTSTACSASALQVCCALLPACGVRRVSRRRPVHPKVPGVGGPFPATRFDPTKSSPRQQPFLHRCIRCLPVVSVHPRVRRWGPDLRRVLAGRLPSEEERRTRTSRMPKHPDFPSDAPRPKPSRPAAEAVGKPRGYLACQPKLARDLPLPKQEKALPEGRRPSTEVGGCAGRGSGRLGIFSPKRVRRSHRGGSGTEGPVPGSRGCSDPPKRTPTSTRWARNQEVRGISAEAESSVPSCAPEFVATSRLTRCQVRRSTALRGSGRLQGLAPLTSPLRRPAVSSEPSPVSPMGLCPLRGPLVSAAVPPQPRRRSDEVGVEMASGPKLGGLSREDASRQSPGVRWVGPFPGSELLEKGSAASLRGFALRPVPELLPSLVS